MKVLIRDLNETFEGSPAEIVEQMAANRWDDMQAHEYMRAAAARARIYTGKPIRPWRADLFIKDLMSAGLIEIVL